MDVLGGGGGSSERDGEVVGGEEGVHGGDGGLLVGTLLVEVEGGDSDIGGAAAG